MEAEYLGHLCLQMLGCNEETRRARAEVQMAGRLKNTGTSFDMPIAQACLIASRKDKRWQCERPETRQNLCRRTDIGLYILRYFNNKLRFHPVTNVLYQFDWGTR